MEHLQNYCLRWNNYQTNLVKVFDEMLKNENFTDVTIVTENGAKFKCHKMILAACSKFFQDIFINVPCEQHLVVLLKDVKSHDMSHILEYMYTGQVNVEQSRLTSIIRTAEELQIKGLTGDEKLTRPEDDDHRMDDVRPSRPSSNNVQTVVHSSSMHSPPHSTNSMYKNPYSNMYSKMHPNDRANMNLNMWHVPGLALPPPSAQMENSSNHFSGPSPPIMSPYDQPPPEVYHHRRKKFSSVMMPKDTPILRTVLGQGQDMSQPVSLVVNQGDVKEENTDQERKPMKEELLDDASSPYSDQHSTNGEDVKPNIAITANSYPTDMNVISNGTSNYSPLQKPEWKRYKQYSRENLNSAIKSVSGGMLSALQAAKKFNVPSRTLYDKLKKLGIVTSRAFKRANSSSNYRQMIRRQADSPYHMTLQETRDNQHDALKKLFSALSSPENGEASNQRFDHDTSLLRLIQQNWQPRSPSIDGDQHTNGTSNGRQPEHDDEQVEDLSLNKRQEGVIVSPMHQVTAIVKAESIKKEINEDPRREMCISETE